MASTAIFILVIIIGGKLIEHAILRHTQLYYKTLIAIILDKNQDSIGLLAEYGFSKWGHLPNITSFDGIECGHVYYGLRVEN